MSWNRNEHKALIIERERKNTSNCQSHRKTDRARFYATKFRFVRRNSHKMFGIKHFYPLIHRENVETQHLKLVVSHSAALVHEHTINSNRFNAAVNTRHARIKRLEKWHTNLVRMLWFWSTGNPFDLTNINISVWFSYGAHLNWLIRFLTYAYFIRIANVNLHNRRPMWIATTFERFFFSYF